MYEPNHSVLWRTSSFFIDLIELGTRKSQDHLETSNIGKSLSMGVPFKPEQELLQQTYRYVLENTIDVQPHTEIYEGFATTISYKSKNQKWLQEEHNQTLHWLREEVSTELELGNTEVSNNLSVCFIRLMDDLNEELGVGELNATFGIEDEKKEIGIGNETLK
ncbi:uncharacterized protein LOC127151329 [Cucumis melo]|uniref:Uncharacterized protein LOC127151329 n=1 Tax=Cucumis melo TaxID=3656 RepID=A0ABM3L9T9_CUCME|nr:uncharacterized protein LOC127151329 [Cucumis melo]